MARRASGYRANLSACTGLAIDITKAVDEFDEDKIRQQHHQHG